ncbi:MULTISPECIES: signal recognition particle-docking protein FtsY [Fusobacterium]|uniref:signal recognition particle-docking protein FtsY n=1 Tax=Fusobacterium TaxID=848 RepID=UPI001F3F38EB|nr:MULTISPECIES: signal recognition particle-docking protein FtsY [Fusobacterium]MCF2612572.1 signal recognition particle-docking protein FtsY [Fusobacterium perfoetens]MDY2980451.1 signal recognition particle-docking protein FtsY [Fusobacterium sp.]
MGFFDKLFGRKKKEEKEEIIEQKEEVVEKVSEESQIKEEVLVEEEKVVVQPEPTPEVVTKEEINIDEEKKSDEKEGNSLVKENIQERVEVIEAPKKEVEATEKKGFFTSLKEKLFRTREGLFKKIKNIFSGRTTIDADLYEELEELLIQSDIGFDMTVKIVSALEKEVGKRGITNPEDIYEVLKDVMTKFLITEGNELDIVDGELNVILVVGVNGVGKTTTIGKLAKKYKSQGKKVIVGAADTFRAAAIEQLEEWGQRAGVEIVKKEQGSDPGAVVFDAIQVAQDKKADLLIIDTAGRLHNKSNLMKELEKINNIIQKKLGHTRYESILVIDGTTGQNGLSQAKIFNEVTKLTGFIVTKLDGTAKGGIVFSISEEIKKPIKYIGVGEKIEDLREFNVKDYIDAIFD